MLQNQLEHKSYCQNQDFLLGLKFQFLRCQLESYFHKPKVIALTKTWLTKSDIEHLKSTGKILEHHKDYCIASFHPIESKPRKEYKREGVAFYVHETLKYSPIEYDTDIECAIIEVDFRNSFSRNFCVVYRPQANKLTSHICTFLPEFEGLLQFLRSLKHYTNIFGDFNIDTVKHSADKIKYENILLAFNFRAQNCEPTRVTPTSSTCLDHYITSYQTLHQTETTTMSDHYTVLGEIPYVKVEVTTESHCKTQTRNLKNIKGENTLKFWFISNKR